MRIHLLPPVGWMAILVWGLIFAISYCQAPLYTSNQNQYFLHGLAQAGYGDLAQDWLANTLDPTPVFSKIVELTYAALGADWVFYIYYAALQVIYLFSLWGIASEFFDLRSSPIRSLLFLSGFTLIHSAGWRYALALAVGSNWSYILEDGVADQRLLGVVLQPSAFGVFLLLSICFFVRGNPLLAVLSATAAAIVHPTYMLAAATLTGTYVLDTGIWKRQPRQALLYGGSALVVAAPVVIPAFTIFAGAPGDITEQARRVLVEYRIPHHALLGEWFDATAVVKMALVVVAIWLVWRVHGRRSSLLRVLGISAGVMAALTMVQVLSRSYSLALLFPWRLSTYLVPLSTAIILAAFVEWLCRLPWMEIPNARKGLAAVCLLAVGLSVLAGGVRFILDMQRKASGPERAVENMVAVQRKPGDIYLTPVKMQDFRLAAGAAAYIDFKSIPYRGEEVLEWFQREQLADRFYKCGDCNVLDEILLDAPVTHVITEPSEDEIDCPQLDMLYTDASYALWRVR